MKNLSHQNFEHSDLLVSQDWTFPVPIAYGPGRFSEIGKHCVREDISNPLIVTDRGSKDLPLLLKPGTTSHMRALPVRSFQISHQIHVRKKLQLARKPLTQAPMMPS